MLTTSCSSIPKTILLAVILLIIGSSIGMAETSTKTEGNCPDGTPHSKWWTVTDYDDYGNIICTTNRNCFGEVTSDCGPSTTQGTPDQRAIVTISFTTPSTGNKKWILTEYDAYGQIVSVVTKYVGGAIVREFIPIGGIIQPQSPDAPNQDSQNENIKEFERNDKGIPDMSQFFLRKE